ncbi:MAG: Fic family protein [Chloroflexota bacterium]
MANESLDFEPNGFLTPERLAELDSSYIPIAALDEWITGRLDLSGLNRVWASVEEKQSQTSQAELDQAVEVALRAAAVETGAIENLYKTPPPGLTFSIALSTISWETEMRAHDEQMPDLFLAALSAYKLAFEIAGSRQPITEAWVRRLHEVLTAPQATYRALTSQGWTEIPLPKGVYKSLPNHVLQADGKPHAYAPVDQTSPEMHHLIEQINAPQFQRVSPVIQAAYVHHCFTVIHPFADGNGRVARALSSVFLRREFLIPLLVWNDQRAMYFEALTAADSGNTEPFSEFVRDCAIDTLRLVVTSMTAKSGDYVDTLKGLHVARDGLTHQELDAVARQLRENLAQVLNRLIGELGLPAGVNFAVQSVAHLVPNSDPAFRDTVGDPSSIRLTLNSARPAQAATERIIAVRVAFDPNSYFAFRTESQIQGLIPLDVRLDDVLRASPSFERIARSWCQSVLTDALGELTAAAALSLRQSGYASS